MKFSFLSYGFLFLTLFSFMGKLYGQKTNVLHHEISITTDNDFFAGWSDSDQFYSYGIGGSFKFRKDTFLGFQNQFNNRTGIFYEVGLQAEGYTPSQRIAIENSSIPNDFTFDRPFAGLLYSTINATYTFEKSYLKIGTLAGIMGPASMAGKLQAWFHKAIVVDISSEGWTYQAPNQILLNTSINYAYDFTPSSKGLDIFGKIAGRLGNLYIDATPTLTMRLGKFNPLTRTTSEGNRILSNTSNIELFLQSSVGGSISAFDATAQGNLFRNDFPFALKDVNTFHSNMTHALHFSSRRISASFAYIFTYGKVLKNTSHVYGSASMSYQF